MQKKIIALAIAAAFAAPVAMADTANVNVYGVVNVSADNVKGTTGNTANPQVSNIDESRGRISSNNSFIGFKGSEDLGDGLSAVWQIETAVAMDQGALNASSTRNTFAGLSSKTMGTMTFGIIDSPLKTSTGPLAEFTNTLADYRSLFTTTATSLRPANSALYVSPTMAGFVVRAMYAAQNETGNNSTTVIRSDPSLYSMSATYTDGPIFAVLAAENTKVNTTAAFAPGVFDPATGTTTAVAQTTGMSATKTTRAGFGYTFGDAKVGVAMENYEATNAALARTIDVRSAYVSASYKMGLNTLKAAYTRRGDDNGTGKPTANDGATQMTIGMDRALNKRTTAYALVTNLRNDDAGKYMIGGGATGISPISASSSEGKNQRGVSFGMVHVF